MKLNVISDIHASLDKNGKVIYNAPLRHGKNKIVEAFGILRDFWMDMVKNDRVKNLKMIDQRNDEICLSLVIELKTADDITKFLERFGKDLDGDFNGVSKDDIFVYSRSFINLRDIFAKNSIVWNYRKTKLDLNSISTYMFQVYFEFKPENLAPADYLIIAGDLGYSNTYMDVLKDIEEKNAGKFKRIMHIAGNHDHWWMRRPDMQDEMRPEHVNLDHDYYEYDDGEFVFLGCTLWTPIPERDTWTVSRCMNDYRYIPDSNWIRKCYASSYQYQLQSKWLKNKLDQYKDRKVIVFTHHQPFEELTLEDYKHNGWDDENVNSAYCVLDHSMDDINKNNNIKLYICGHTHQSYDGILHNVHVVRNPIGYRSDYGYIPPENWRGNWYNNIIEIN